MQTVEDSQLRMIFLACHPFFSKEEQIAFALKSISGFSLKEISAALMQKEETIKKRLSRARKKIKNQNIKLVFPDAHEINNRISGVLQIIYLIFNEGFHSTKHDSLINKDLCGEALRLCKLLLAKEQFRTGSLYAMFALLCFHSSRLDTKILEGKIIDLKHQDRKKWYLPLINLGYQSLAKSAEFSDTSIYHIEAAIALEHIKSAKFEDTNWGYLIELYDDMYELLPSDNILLSKSSIFIQLNELDAAMQSLSKINVDNLNQRKYLYYGILSDYHGKKNEFLKAKEALNTAKYFCSNQMEINYLEEKLLALIASS